MHPVNLSDAENVNKRVQYLLKVGVVSKRLNIIKGLQTGFVLVRKLCQSVLLIISRKKAHQTIFN